MRRKTTTGNSPPITKRPYRSLLACAALLVGAARATAAAPAVDHIRGIILGTTITSLDVGTPTRADIHLEMALQPFVAIAEPADASALVSGAFAAVLTDAKKDRVRCVVIVPDTAHVFSSGRTTWDAPGAPSMLTGGRIAHVDTTAHPVGFTLSVGATSRHFTIAKNTPIITLRPGTRAALLSPHNVFVFATPPTTELTDFVRSIIVADGTLELPF